MLPKKKDHPPEKADLHPRNRHRARYDFNSLTTSLPELKQYVKQNNYQDESIDFFNPDAVKTLNKALLKHNYQIDYWDIPPGYLCPPIPGRADYIHYLADLLGSQRSENNQFKIPTGNQIKCLDVGVGANCVYPIIGVKEYGWSFIGSDIDLGSITNATKIAELNPGLKNLISLRLQPRPTDIFTGIIQKDEHFDLTICNPPFHASAAEALAGSVRKISNLKGKKITQPTLNFGGQKNELWCPGGESAFITTMIRQSKPFGQACFWFTTLVSKEANLRNAFRELKLTEAVEVKTISMSQGNKVSRILAWTFLKPEDRKRWIKARWQH